jgi:hypothetical protein
MSTSQFFNMITLPGEKSNFLGEAINNQILEQNALQAEPQNLLKKK